MIQKGDAFWMKSPDEAKNHLHVVISDPSLSPSIVLVPIATKWLPADDACVFDGGEHPRLPHSSYADYRLTKLLTCKQIEDAIATRQVKKVEAMSDEQMSRLWAGAAIEANAIPGGCRQILFAQGLLG